MISFMQVYSNGESERILGKAIKELALPRDEIVILTKVHIIPSFSLPTLLLDLLCCIERIMNLT